MPIKIVPLFSTALTCSLTLSVTLFPLPATAQSDLAITEPSIIRFQHENPLEPSLIKIRQITVVGTEYVDAVKLSLRTRVGDEITPEIVKEEQQRIVDLGYFSDVTPRLIAQPDGYELVIYVRENPMIHSVVLSNTPTFLSSASVLKELSVLSEQRLNFSHLQDVKKVIEDRYRKADYALAHVSFQDFDGKWLDDQGQLHVAVHEGVIESIVIEGNARTDNDVILRELRLKPGDTFKQNTFQEDLQRLHRLDFFETIDVVPTPGKVDPHHFELRLVVTEKKTADIGLNFSLNNRDGLLGGVHFTDPNFLGKGKYFNAKFQAGLDLLNLFDGNRQQSQRSFFGRVDFVEPFLLPDRTSFGGSLFSDRTPLFFNQATLPEGLNTGDGLFQTRTGVSLNVGRPLFGDLYSPWHGDLSFTAEQVTLQDFAQKARPELTFSQRRDASDTFFNLAGALSFDDRDGVLDPHRGTYGSLRAQPVWGDGNYLKLAGNIATFVPLLDPGLTLAMGLQGGALLGKHPIYEQFFGTGPSSIRGWQENGSLAGSQYLVGTLEARFPVYQPVSGVVFTDMGNFFGSPLSRMDELLNFKYGVGAGVRINTPLGLLRLDYGVRDFSRLNWNSWLDAGQLHFSIGHKF
jgi:outer membrane protein insertion porin family